MAHIYIRESEYLNKVHRMTEDRHDDYQKAPSGTTKEGELKIKEATLMHSSNNASDLFSDATKDPLWTWSETMKIVAKASLPTVMSLVFF
jgi:hypothetical protein